MTAAVRNVKHTGITGDVEFDDKGDPKKALYFVLQVASDNPEKWGDNKEVKRLTIAAPDREEVRATRREGCDGHPPPPLALLTMDGELLVGILPQVVIDGLILGFMYALIALGYTMVYGVLQFINFAHSEVFIVGAFVGVEILLGLKAAGVLETAARGSSCCSWSCWPAWRRAGSSPSPWSASRTGRSGTRRGSSR